MKQLTHAPEKLPTTDELTAGLALANAILWKEIRKLPKLSRKMDQYPDFHLLTGALFPPVECCSLQFRLSRDEAADCDEDGLPIMVNHFLRLSEEGYRSLINVIESMGVFDTTRAVMLPLKIGGIEAYDSPRQDHH